MNNYMYTWYAAKLYLICCWFKWCHLWSENCAGSTLWKSSFAEVVLLWFLGRLTCCLRWGRKSKWVCLMHDGFAKCRPWGRWKILRDAKVSMEQPAMMQWLLAQWTPTRQWEHERHLDNKKSGSILRRWNCQMSRATRQRSQSSHISD